MKHAQRVVLLGLFGLALFGNGRAVQSAQTLTVCASGCDFSTVQVAIDMAQDGDVVEVQAGIYQENVLIRNVTNLTLQGAGANAVTLDGSLGKSHLKPTLTFDNSNNVTVQGFRIVKGYGGIILEGDTTATVQDNTITSGIAVYGQAEVTIRNNTIEGGGIELTGSASATIENNTIRGNTGAGIALSDQVQVTIVDNTIENTKPNLRGDFGYGIELTGSASATIENNTIRGNTGTGIALFDQVQVTIADNTIENTRPTREGRFGRGIDVSGSVLVTIENNTIRSNASAGIFLYDRAQATIIGNTIENTKLNSQGNFGNGIELTKSASATVESNTVHNNVGCGIRVSNSTRELPVTGNRNLLSDNHPNICDDDGKLPLGFEGVPIPVSNDTEVSTPSPTRTTTSTSLPSEVLFEDRFNDPLSGWKQDPLWTYTEGEYRVFLRKESRGSWSLAPDPDLFTLDEYCVEVQVRLFVDVALSKDGIVGFYVAAKQKDKKTFPEGVVIALNGAGRVLVADTLTKSDGSFFFNVRLNTSGLVDDPSQFQTLRIAAKGGSMTITLNSLELLSFKSKARGKMGFIGVSFKEPNLNARFDNLKISSSCP